MTPDHNTALERAQWEASQHHDSMRDSPVVTGILIGLLAICVAALGIEGMVYLGWLR